MMYAHKYTVRYVVICILMALGFALLPLQTSIGTELSVGVSYTHAQTGGVESDLVQSVLGTLGSLAREPIEFILTLVVYVVGFFMLMMANLFDAAILYTVIDFGNTFSTAGIDDGINAAWSGLRDIANIVMIAMFIFVAFATILNMQSYGLKQFALRLILVALLINFSLFFTKAIIDISNATATQFAQAIRLEGSSDFSIAEGFLGEVGLEKVTYDSARKALDEAADFQALVVYSVMSLIFYSIMLALFLLGFILLVTRAVTLLMLMMLSALAFAGHLVPQYGGKWWSQWLGALFKNAIFAPLLMLLLWASANVVGEISSGDSLALANYASGSGWSEAGAWKPVIMILVIAGLFYASHKIASDLSLVGANFAKKWSGWALGRSLTLSATPLIPFQKFGAYLTRQGARSARENLPVGPRLNAALSKLETRALNLGDSKISKQLEKATGARLGYQSASIDDIAAYQALKSKGKDSQDTETTRDTLDLTQGTKPWPPRDKEDEKKDRPNVDPEGERTPSPREEAVAPATTEKAPRAPIQTSQPVTITRSEDEEEGSGQESKKVGNANETNIEGRKVGDLAERINRAREARERKEEEQRLNDPTVDARTNNLRGVTPDIESPTPQEQQGVEDSEESREVDEARLRELNQKISEGSEKAGSSQEHLANIQEAQALEQKLSAPRSGSVARAPQAPAASTQQQEASAQQANINQAQNAGAEAAETARTASSQQEPAAQSAPEQNSTSTAQVKERDVMDLTPKRTPDEWLQGVASRVSRGVNRARQAIPASPRGEAIAKARAKNEGKDNRTRQIKKGDPVAMLEEIMEKLDKQASDNKTESDTEDKKS